MPSKELMNWVSSQKRWRVQKDKQPYWYNPINDGLPRTKEGSREGANKFWIKKEAELNQADQRKWNERKYLDEYDTNIAEMERMIAIGERFNNAEDKEFIESLKVKLVSLKQDRERKFQLKRLTRSQKSPLQITADDTFAAVVASMKEPAAYLVFPGEEDFERFHESNNDVPNAKSLAVWEDRLKNIDKILSPTSSAVSKNESLGYYIDRFITRKRKQCEAGVITVHRVDKIVNDLNKFVTFFGKERSVQEIDRFVIEDYYNWILDQIAIRKKWEKDQSGEKGYSAHYASYLLSIFKTFLRDLDENGIINVPKTVFNKTTYVIRRPTTTNENIPAADIQTILASSEVEERTKLFVLLALNCAMYQNDISSLRQDEVDWVKGIITRKRTKTQSCANVPTVSFKLWDKTFLLLKKYRAKTGDLALLNQNGTPFVTVKFAAGGNKKTTSDAIADAWERARDKLKMPDHVFMNFRKTSANLIANNEKFQGLENLFLAHAPRLISERHYTNAEKGKLDNVLQWLGGELGIK